jgi:hypothetical protein
MAKKTKQQTQDEQDELAAQLLLKEADESLRQDKLNAFWDEWGSTIISVVAMVVLGTILGVGWQSWQGSRQAAGTNTLIALEQNPEAEIAIDGHYGAVAGLIRAGQYADAGLAAQNGEEVTRLFQQAAEANLPQEWDLLAEWGALRMRADVAEAADVKIGVARDMVELAEHSDNPYHPAILMEAGVLFGEHGERKQALIALENAANNEAAQATPDLLQKIAAYHALYTRELTEVLND